ncbi:MAG: outer membrane protein assembly factor BamD [Spirochaetaceae bacterium]|nr:outer membrane protein assembly factor BamD [Spirochaetaceae bacterium]
MKVFGKIFIKAAIVFIFLSCATTAKETENNSTPQPIILYSNIAPKTDPEHEAKPDANVTTDVEAMEMKEAEAQEVANEESVEIEELEVEDAEPIEDAEAEILEKAEEAAVPKNSDAEVNVETATKADAAAKTDTEAREITTKGEPLVKAPERTADFNLAAKAPLQEADNLAAISPARLPYQDTLFPIVNPDDEERTVIYTMPGTIEIELERTGWIYTGEKNGKRGIVLDSRKFVNGNTVFSFKITENDDYNIVFQLQNTSGDSEISNIYIRMDEAGKDSGSIASNAGNEDPGSKITTSPERKENIENTKASSPQFAPLSTDTDSKIAAAIADTTSIPSSIVIPPQDVLKNATALADRGDYISAIDMLEQSVQNYPRHSDMDKIYYFLAKYYEADTAKKSAKKSIGYYSRIVDEYPLSDYVDESEKRIKYLEKHFIFIN